MLKTYSADEVSVIVGNRVIKGLIQGDAVTISRESDAFSDSVGLDGEVTRSSNKDKRGSVVLTLQQGSSDNDFLSALSQADELAGSGVIPILVRDANGTSLYESVESWIMKPADGSVSQESGERAWTFRCAKLKMFSGGN